MKIFLLIPFLVLSSWANEPESKPVSKEDFISSKELKLSRYDFIIAEKVVSVLKLLDKGYVNQDLLSALAKDVNKSKNYKPFQEWLSSIKDISAFKTTADLIGYCGRYSKKKETLPLERLLEIRVGNYCRERALEAIGRDVDKNEALGDEAVLFIQENLKFFLTKKNKKNFAFFLQSQSARPEILKKLSQEITTYSVRNEIVPSQEVLQDILINEQITKLIQSKGFNPLQHKNVFYSEYGKLIESGYRALSNSPKEEVVREHYKHLKNYLQLNQAHLPVSLCLTRLNDFSKAVFRNGFVDLSRDMLKFMVKKDFKDIQSDAYFFYLWTYISTDDYKGAYKIADKNGLLKPDNKVNDSQLNFWIGFIQEKLEKTQEAIQNYEAIVKNDPLSYYAIMANKKLLLLKPDSPVVNFYPTQLAIEDSNLAFDPQKLNPDHLASLVRLKAWAKMDNQHMVNLELKRLRLHSLPGFVVTHPSEVQLAVKSDLHIIHARLLQESENHLATFRYIYSVLDKKEVAFNRNILNMLYPRPYYKDLINALKKDNIDPIILISLIRQESVFNPRAMSPVGARGLMQLMPATAKRMRRSVHVKHLVNPKVNIELGTKYFKGLMQRYDGNLVYVLSAYNAGETRVERWKKQYWNSDDTILKNIEAIPFSETRTYVKLIFRNIFFYKLLIENNKELANSGEANKIFDVPLGFKH